MKRWSTSATSSTTVRDSILNWNSLNAALLHSINSTRFHSVLLPLHQSQDSSIQDHSILNSLIIQATMDGVMGLFDFRTKWEGGVGFSRFFGDSFEEDLVGWIDLPRRVVAVLTLRFSNRQNQSEQTASVTSMTSLTIDNVLECFDFLDNEESEPSDSASWSGRPKSPPPPPPLRAPPPPPSPVKKIIFTQQLDNTLLIHLTYCQHLIAVRIDPARISFKDSFVVVVVVVAVVLFLRLLVCSSSPVIFSCEIIAGIFQDLFRIIWIRG